ncbi:UNVERIFIED_CONTAM: hypothetical protein K2H54_003296 [Gekko kuhli]
MYRKDLQGPARHVEETGPKEELSADADRRRVFDTNMNLDFLTGMDCAALESREGPVTQQTQFFTFRRHAVTLSARGTESEN